MNAAKSPKVTGSRSMVNAESLISLWGCSSARPISAVEPRRKGPSGIGTIGVEPTSANPQLPPQARDNSKVLLSVERDIEDVKVPLRDSDAAEAVVAVGEVVAQLQVGAVAAVLGANAVRAGVAALRANAVAAIGAQGAIGAVGAVVTAVAGVAEHAVGAPSAAGALVGAGVARVRGEAAGQVVESLEEVSLGQGGDLRPLLLFERHGLTSRQVGSTSVFGFHDLPFNARLATAGIPAGPPQQLYHRRLRTRRPLDLTIRQLPPMYLPLWWTKAAKSRSAPRFISCCEVPIAPRPRT